MAALVLAIEPDLRQATIIKRIVRDRVKADVSVVESPDAALTAIGIRIPDVLLLSALLSPRDEDELMGHLRSLDGADHIQTHTIPQLATTDADQEQGGRRGLLGVFKRKKETPQPIVSGCDPDMFAEEILTFIQRAAEKKEESIAALQSRVDQLEYLVQSGTPPATATTAGAARPTIAHESVEESSSSSSESAWASPFEWRKTTTPAARPAESPESLVAGPGSLVDSPESSVPSHESVSSHESLVAGPESLVDSPESSVVGHESLSSHEPITGPESHIIAGSDSHDRGDTSYASTVHRDESVRLDSDVTHLDDSGSPTYSDLPPVELAPQSDVVAHAPVIETTQEPPAPARSKRGSDRRKNTVAPATLLRLTPLAMWARIEASDAPSPRAADAPEPKTVTEELRNLMANLAVPPHVAGVSYGRGCRIRRVRVLGGRERRRADAPGPVILSRRTLERQREANQ